MGITTTDMQLQLRFCIERRHLIETGRPITTAIFYADPHMSQIERVDGPRSIPEECYTPRVRDIAKDVCDNRAYTLPFVTSDICRSDCSIDGRKILFKAEADELLISYYYDWESCQMCFHEGLGVHPDDQVKYKKEIIMSDATILKVSEEFTEAPGGRYKTDGDFSAELFRDTILLPAVKKAIDEKKKLLIDLDGGYGYAFSFIEEAFGGLVRKGLRHADLCDYMNIKSNEDLLAAHKAWEYITEEATRQREKEDK